MLVPFHIRRERTEVPATLQISGKRVGRSLAAASDRGLTTRRLFVTDQESKVRFLVDTGADLCVYPRTYLRGLYKKSTYELSAANGTVISTYGTITLALKLGLRRVFPWKFVIADVSKPIIGADFLAHFGLLVDIHNGQLIDETTGVTSRGHIVESKFNSIKVITGKSQYH